MKDLKLALFFICISSIIIGSSYFINEGVAEGEESEEDEKKPTDWLYSQRAYPFEHINHESFVEAVRQLQNIRNQSIILRGDSDWAFAGPSNAGGRITSLGIHPSDAQTIYIGSAAGGVFKTTDGGILWTPIFDKSSSLSIGDLAVAPSDKNILYVGTGEANGGGGSVNFEGTGVFKSVNGGASWQNMGLPNSGSIGRVVVDPQNANRVFVGAMGYLYAPNAERGIYRTFDGGQTWEKVFYLTDSTGCIDLAMHPQNSNILYAAMWERMRYPDSRNYGGATCGIYRSIDGGTSWVKLTNGLPSTDIGRIGIAISPVDPSVVYGIYTDKIGYFKGIFKTNDGGNAWTRFDAQGYLTNMFSSYGWWFGRIVADPVDVNTVYALGLDIFKTTDAGQSWSNISNTIHVDHHSLWINPQNNKQMYVGNDGGFYSTENGGNTWSWADDLPITQFYTCEIDKNNPSRAYGGTQDNGTWRTLTGNTNDWQNILGGDGFVSLVDPVNSQYVYASIQNGFFYRSANGGASFTYSIDGINLSEPRNWKTPIVFSPDNPSVLYYGTNRLYRSTDRAYTWTAISPDLSKATGTSNLAFGTITTIAISPLNAQIIYCGTDDGNAWVTSDGGSNWVKITNNLPNRWVTSIAADPFDANTAYITFSGYKWKEYQPHILKTTNKGQNWVDISTNLPQAPINDVIIDPVLNNKNTKTLYVATDFGVFISYNDGASWSALGSNLPLVSVMDIALHESTRTLLAATHGRSMYHINVAQNVPSFSIAGSLKREKGDTVTAQISLFKNASLFQSLSSSLFSFNSLEGNPIYSVKPVKNDNPSQGVTTFDIAIITRHILDITPLSTPYKMVAADVNNDGEIDAQDVLLIRRIVLRQIEAFPNNTSWRFIPKNYVFLDTKNPFSGAIPNELIFNGLNESILNADFYAIKVGDVNESANLFQAPVPDSIVHETFKKTR